MILTFFDILFSDFIIHDSENRNQIHELPDYYNNFSDLLFKILQDEKIPDRGVIIKKELFNNLGSFNSKFKNRYLFEFLLRSYPNAKIKKLNCYIKPFNIVETNQESAQNLKEEARIIDKFFDHHSPNEIFLELSPDNKAQNIILNIETAYIFSKRFYEERALYYYLSAFPQLIDKYRQGEMTNKAIWKDILGLLKIIFKENIDHFTRHKNYINIYIENSNLYKIISDKNIFSLIERESKLNNVLITICIPTFNRAQYLKESVNSALKQNGDFEILVIDDGSEEDTKNVIDALESEKLRYIYKANEGRPKTRNKFIKEARGEYLLWLDDDDILAPNIIENYSSIINKDSLMMIIIVVFV